MNKEATVIEDAVVMNENGEVVVMEKRNNILRMALVSLGLGILGGAVLARIVLGRQDSGKPVADRPGVPEESQAGGSPEVIDVDAGCSRVV